MFPGAGCSTTTIPGQQYLEDIPEESFLLGTSLTLTCLSGYTFPDNETSHIVSCERKVERVKDMVIQKVGWNIADHHICQRKKISVIYLM